jgi:hypothetical protein
MEGKKRQKTQNVRNKMRLKKKCIRKIKNEKFVVLPGSSF